MGVFQPFSQVIVRYTLFIFSFIHQSNKTLQCLFSSEQFLDLYTQRDTYDFLQSEKITLECASKCLISAVTNFAQLQIPLQVNDQVQVYENVKLSHSAATNSQCGENSISLELCLLLFLKQNQKLPNIWMHMKQVHETKCSKVAICTERDC